MTSGYLPGTVGGDLVTPRAFYDAHALHSELDTQRVKDGTRAVLA